MSQNRLVQIRYGRTGLALRVPAEAAVLTGAQAPGLARSADAIRTTLKQPIGSAPLMDLLTRRRPKSVAITISDITRPVPNALILPVLLETLNAAGVPDQAVTIIVGTGMHRPSTPAEQLELVGPEILRRCAVVDHRADDPTTLTKVADHPPVAVNTQFMRADFRIVTGLIEPHFMAGYSGGRKGVCPALVDLATVQRFHGPAILSDARSASGRLAGNPCHAESLRVARLVGIDFLLNVAINQARELAAVYAGDMEAAHEAGVREVAEWTSARVEKPFDLVITSGGGYPLDQTFYQAVKGMVAALPACHKRSTILIAAECGEGIGSESYRQVMQNWSGDWRGFLAHIAQTPTVSKDQWQAQMQARVLAKIGTERLWLACDALPLEQQRCLWVTPVPGDATAAERSQRAVDRYLADHPDARIGVIPDGPYTMLQAG